MGPLPQGWGKIFIPRLSYITHRSSRSGGKKNIVFQGPSRNRKTSQSRNLFFVRCDLCFTFRNVSPPREKDGLHRSGLLRAPPDADDAVGGPQNAGVGVSQGVAPADRSPALTVNWVSLPPGC